MIDDRCCVLISFAVSSQKSDEKKMEKGAIKGLFIKITQHALTSKTSKFGVKKDFSSQ
jgi:hypothetical protein